MKNNKVKTYMDTLMANEEFRKKFEKEYQKICLTNKKRNIASCENRPTLILSL